MIAYLVIETLSLVAYAGKYVLGKVGATLYNAAYSGETREISLLDIQEHLDRIEAKLAQTRNEHEKKIIVADIQVKTP